MVALPVNFVVVVVLIMHAVYKARADYILPLKNFFPGFILIFRVFWFVLKSKCYFVILLPSSLVP